MSALRQYLLDHGVYLYTHWNTILIIPPLIITQSELEQGLSVIDQSLYEMDKVVNH